MKTKFIASLLSLVLLAACGPKAVRPASPAKNPNFISHAEITAALSENANAYEIIHRLRPSFLHWRGTSTMGRGDEPTLVVYLDMVKVAGTPITSLKSINAAQIRSIEYLNGIDATTRFGTDHGAGAILISTRGPVE